MALKRITKELNQIKEINNLSYTIQSEENDVFNLQVTLMGPEYTPYEGGLFFISIKMPTDYPFKPPKCLFLTKIYHPNINDRGEITMVKSLDDWSPAYTLKIVMEQIIELLIEACPDDPWVPEIARIYKEDKNQFNITAQEWTKKYAIN
ncbi:MAG: ubiquitin-conjugating enzyme E2 [bacterium]